MMIKKLSVVGNDVGVLIERPILELLGIDLDTPLEVTTEGRTLMIRAASQAPLVARALRAADELMDAHEETFRKLAE
jgi:antitoxin component of MazEF toxin-antitoxin module